MQTTGNILVQKPYQMIEELKVYDEINAAIMDGSYGHAIDEMYVIHCSSQLHQQAEIFISLKPEHARIYLLYRKMDLYRMLTRIAEQIEEVDKGKQLQLQFLEVSMAQLHKTYCEWLAELEKT